MMARCSVPFGAKLSKAVPRGKLKLVAHREFGLEFLPYRFRVSGVMVPKEGIFEYSECVWHIPPRSSQREES